MVAEGGIVLGRLGSKRLFLRDGGYSQLEAIWGFIKIISEMLFVNAFVILYLLEALRLICAV